MTSEVGEGTTFTIYPPRHGRAAAASEDAEQVPHGDGETVMLVERRRNASCG